MWRKFDERNECIVTWVFLFPEQTSKLMISEMEDWITDLAPALWPICGYMMVPNYPTQRAKLSHGHKYCNVVSYIKQWV